MNKRINYPKRALTSKLKKFNNESKVYLPIFSHSKILVKKGEYVYKEQLLANCKGKLPIYSSTSGIFLGNKTIMNNGEKKYCMVIESDHTNNIQKKQTPKIKTKEDFVKCLYDNALIGMGGGGYPTYLKYKNINSLIINATECEPYISADECLIYQHIEEILKTLTKINEIFELNHIIIAVKKRKLAKDIRKYLKNYPSIKLKLVPDYYPVGWSKALVQEVLDVTIETHSSDSGIVVENISTVYAIGQALNNKPLVERIVTFDGDAIENPSNIIIKNGTKLTEVLTTLKIEKDNCDIIAGGPMMGKKIEEDLIFNPQINAVLFIKNKKETPTACIRCGKCIQHCSASLAPVLIKDNISHKNNLKQLHPEKCIECGLCSYVCPAKLPVRNFVLNAKKIIEEDNNVKK